MIVRFWFFFRISRGRKKVIKPILSDIINLVEEFAMHKVKHLKDQGNKFLKKKNVQMPQLICYFTLLISVLNQVWKVYLWMENKMRELYILFVYLKVRVCSTGSTMLYSTAYPRVSPKKNFMKDGMFQSLMINRLLCSFPSAST